MNNKDFKTRMYIAIAENAKGELLGLCEKKPCGNYHWSKHKVRLFLPTVNVDKIDTPLQRLQNAYPSKMTDKNFVSKMLKAFRSIDKKEYITYGRSKNEYGYRWVKHTAAQTKLPKGFTYRVYRVGSQNCPVEVDMHYLLYVWHTHPEQKDVNRHAYGNPCFFEKLSHIMSVTSGSIPAWINTTGVPGEDAGQDSPCAKASQTSESVNIQVGLR